MATGTLTVYDSFWKQLMDGGINLASDTIRCALVGSGYTPDRTVHDFFSDITSEASGAGYTAGGVALSGKAVTQDNVNDRAAWSADDATWAAATVTFRYAVLYRDSGAAATSALIAYIDFGADLVYSSQTVTVDFPAAGILTVGGTLPGDAQAFNSFYTNLLSGNFDLDAAGNTLRLALLADSYTPDVDGQNAWDDISADEASGSGYTAGGAALASQATSTDTVNHRGILDAADVTWSAPTVTFRYMVLYKDTGVPATSLLIALWDWGASRVYTATDVAMVWSSSGIMGIGL